MNSLRKIERDLTKLEAGAPHQVETNPSISEAAVQRLSDDELKRIIEALEQFRYARAMTLATLEQFRNPTAMTSSMPDKGLVDAIFASERVRRLIVYLARGRCFASMDHEVLMRYWTERTLEWYRNGGGPLSANVDDVQAELDLRNIEPPWDVVGEALTKAAKLSLNDPAVRGRVRDTLGECLTRFDGAAN